MKKYSLEKFKERRKNRKVIKFTIITLIAIIILVFIALYMANKSFNSFIDTYILKKRISENDANSLTIDTDNLSLIYAYDKSLVVYSDGSINFYNTDAKQTGNIEMTLSKPIADSEDKYLALADYGLQKVCLIKSNSLVWQKDIEGKISKVSVNKQGYVAVSVTGTTYESIVMLFNENGDLLFSKYLSTYVIDVDISDDSKYIAIAEVDNSTILPVTKIEMVSVGLASTSSENATINTYEAESNKLLTGMNFQSKNVLVCSFEDYVLKMTDSSSDRLYEFSDLTAYLEVDSRKGFVRIDKEESSVFKSDYRLKITNENNSEKVYIIEGSIKSLVCKDNRIALNLGKEVQFIDNNGWLVKKFIGNQEVKSVLVSNKIGIIVFKDKISIVNL
jgi:hypothetical protein